MYRTNGKTYRSKSHADFEALLTKEGKKRDARKDWVLDERTAMCDEMNFQRSRLGKGPLSMKDVERKENLAVGHSDYAHKFALYCSELVEDTP